MRILILVLAFGFNASAQTTSTTKEFQAAPAPQVTPAPATPAPTTPAPAPSVPAPTAPAPVGAPPPPPAFFYFCQKSNAYFPSVSECQEGWIAVPTGAAVPMPVWAEPLPRATKETVHSQPNAFTVELFGRALLFSLDYDRAISPNFALGVGISSWQMDNWWDDYHATVTVVPVYANYYFNESPNRGYLTLGADWISVTQSGYNNDSFTNNGFAGVAGGGYEMRTGGGFLLRLGGVVIVGRTVDVNPSMSIGVAF